MGVGSCSGCAAYGSVLLGDSQGWLVRGSTLEKPFVGCGSVGRDPVETRPSTLRPWVLFSALQELYIHSAPKTYGHSAWAVEAG